MKPNVLEFSKVFMVFLMLPLIHIADSSNDGCWDKSIYHKLSKRYMNVVNTTRNTRNQELVAKSDDKYNFYKIDIFLNFYLYDPAHRKYICRNQDRFVLTKRANKNCSFTLASIANSYIQFLQNGKPIQFTKKGLQPKRLQKMSSSTNRTRHAHEKNMSAFLDIEGPENDCRRKKCEFCLELIRVRSTLELQRKCRDIIEMERCEKL